MEDPHEEMGQGSHSRVDRGDLPPPCVPLLHLRRANDPRLFPIRKGHDTRYGRF